MTKIFEQLQVVFLNNIFRFISVGVLNTVFSYSVFILLIYLEIYYILSSLVSYSVASILSYWLNKRWTFQADNKNVVFEFLCFIFINVFSLTIGLIVLFLFVEVFIFNLFLGQFFCIAISAFINFYGYKKLFEN